MGLEDNITFHIITQLNKKEENFMRNFIHRSTKTSSFPLLFRRTRAVK